jgi:DNA-binding LacI/PurR family transcriptional regulator
MRITIKDVAEQAQVSKTTVSLVLNEAPGVSAATRERVMRVMETLNYKPDALARSFSSRRAEAVALVMPPFPEAFHDPYFMHLMLGTLEAVRDQGYKLLLEVADTRFVAQRLWDDLFTCKRVDGLLIATPYLDQGYLEGLAARKYPAMLINGARADLPTLDFMGYDDVRCGFDATYYLLGLGHRRIAHIAGPPNQASAVNRLQGYRDALTRARIPYRAEDVLPGDYKAETGEAAMRALLARPAAERPTAIFSANDTMALAAIRTAQKAGLSVPDDLSVIGVDDTGAAELSEPPLTTFRQDIFKLARLAASRFLKRLEARGTPNIPIAERIPMELIERASCGPPGPTPTEIDSEYYARCVVTGL